ncbi:glycosyltransferase [Butyrivibrio sp. YAB3001]|uniref:glycosyltransferase n=1 Tax=Butyrivibrio sp. YAB3001 TaxID=1520812 RepID=UPI0008F67A77|nr:glycosyltransferase [Butyrivibrio sp. YAB3001]SFC23225.1 Glycosyl transferase family 2 [Butyrivibrio sp. YAB3001]
MNFINLTIIIPHYNTPVLLKKLLGTIPNTPEIQVIVIDDNSNVDIDKLDSIKNEYKNNVEFYSNISGIQSAGACRNIGLDHALGKWLMFADADDYFTDEMYSIVSEYFNSEYDQVIFNVTSRYLGTDVMATRHIAHQNKIALYMANPNEKNLERVKKRFSPCARIFRTEIVKSNNLRFSAIKNSNDMYFSIQASCLSKKTAVDERIVYCITRANGSLTTVVSKEAYFCYAEEYGKCYQFAKKSSPANRYSYCLYNKGIIIYDGIRRNVGLKNIIEAINKLDHYKVPFVTKEILDPMYFISQLFINNKIRKNDAKYLSSSI